MPYVFYLKLRAGKLHLIADAFSRSPVTKPTDKDIDNNMLRYIAACDAPLTDVLFQAAESEEYKHILKHIQNRVSPNSLPPNDPCRGLLSFWSDLSISEDQKINNLRWI